MFILRKDNMDKMQSDWLDATLHISPEESRLLNWVEAPTLVDDEEIPDLTNDEEYDILRELENEKV